MKNQKFLWKKLICYLGLITILNSPVYVKASDANTEEEKWFPVSVASIENESNILVNHNYKYDEEGNMIQSPVSLENKARIMVDDWEYLDRLDYLNELISAIENGDIKDIEDIAYGGYDNCFSNLFLCDLYGSDLSCFCYIYDTSDKVYEYRFPLKSEDLTKFFDYFVDDRTKDEILSKEESFFGECLLGNYGILSYSDGYLVSVFEYKYFNELLAEKYLKLNFLDEYTIQTFRDRLKESDDFTNNIIGSCNYYYNLNDTYDVTMEDETAFMFTRAEIHVNVDEYNNPISYNGSRGNEENMNHGISGTFYNGYDAYGNLIYRVEYSDESEDGTAKRRIEQIDMYTYAYGNPAEYDSDSEKFETSACEMSINDIVDIVGDDFDFSDNYVRDTYIIEKTKHLIETTF